MNSTRAMKNDNEGTTKKTKKLSFDHWRLLFTRGILWFFFGADYDGSELKDSSVSKAKLTFIRHSTTFITILIASIYATNVIPFCLSWGFVLALGIGLAAYLLNVHIYKRSCYMTFMALLVYGLGNDEQGKPLTPLQKNLRIFSLLLAAVTSGFMSALSYTTFKVTMVTIASHLGLTLSATAPGLLVAAWSVFVISFIINTTLMFMPLSSLIEKMTTIAASDATWEVKDWIKLLSRILGLGIIFYATFSGIGNFVTAAQEILVEYLPAVHHIATVIILNLMGLSLVLATRLMFAARQVWEFIGVVIDKLWDIQSESKLSSALETSVWVLGLIAVLANAMGMAEMAQTDDQILESLRWFITDGSLENLAPTLSGLSFLTTLFNSVVISLNCYVISKEDSTEQLLRVLQAQKAPEEENQKIEIEEFDSVLHKESTGNTSLQQKSTLEGPSPQKNFKNNQNLIH